MRVGGTQRVWRWRPAIAIAAALGLFCAVTAGWASCGTAVGGVGPPQSAAQHQKPAGVNAAPAHARNATVSPGFSSGYAPTHHKTTTKAGWMTRDRPPTWARSSPPSPGSALPDSFAAMTFRSPRAPSRTPGAVPPDRDVLTRLCVARC
ncbi:hypothetical protein ACKUUI_02720 [Mycobacterium seoulense]|uniref:hypothetical protein n=1 Tax=Mycobacterium seoulense TaxID=386911 RepID=UPI003CF6DDAA